MTVTSGEKGPTRADIAQLPVAHVQSILPNRSPSGHVTSGYFWSSMRTVSLPLAPLIAPPQMRLEPYSYTTGITVLTVISKIVEAIIKTRIQNQVLEI